PRSRVASRSRARSGFSSAITPRARRRDSTRSKRFDTNDGLTRAQPFGGHARRRSLVGRDVGSGRVSTGLAELPGGGHDVEPSFGVQHLAEHADDADADLRAARLV